LHPRSSCQRVEECSSAFFRGPGWPPTSALWRSRRSRKLSRPSKRVHHMRTIVTRRETQTQSCGSKKTRQETLTRMPRKIRLSHRLASYLRERCKNLLDVVWWIWDHFWPAIRSNTFHFRPQIDETKNIDLLIHGWTVALGPKNICSILTRESIQTAGTGGILSKQDQKRRGYNLWATSSCTSGTE
jgi:hypothetical protein